MKKSLTTKVKIISSIIIISIFCGLYLGYKLFKKADKSVPYKFSMNNNSKKVLMRDAIIKSIIEKNELITTETELKETITIDQSWGNLSIFKKIQDINFYGKGIYCINLSQLVEKNIDINNIKRTISITLKKPYIKDISVNENKTEYITVEKGMLRFGEIELPPEEYNAIINEVKEKMTEQMDKEEIYNKALTLSQKVLKDLIKNSIKQISNKDYTIVINFL